MTTFGHVRTALVILGLVAPPMLGASPVLPPTASAPSAAPDAVHATRGVVKAVDANAIVVSRPNGRGDITFTLGPSLRRHGTIAVGTVVSVRYRDQGTVHVAIGVAVQHP